MIFVRQYNPRLAHAVTQVSAGWPNFHIWIPSRVHVLSLDSSKMWPRLLFSPGCTGIAEYLPAPQSVHAAEPVAVLYFPAKQAVHATPFGPEYPVLQTQLSTLVLAAGEFVYKGHA
jgi:hypothetical protein